MSNERPVLKMAEAFIMIDDAIEVIDECLSTKELNDFYELKSILDGWRALRLFVAAQPLIRDEFYEHQQSKLDRAQRELDDFETNLEALRPYMEKDPTMTAREAAKLYEADQARRQGKIQ